MAECWKCGKETGSVAPECTSCLEGFTEEADIIQKRPVKKPTPVYVNIDWDKVKTLADVIAVISGADLKFIKGSPSYWRLKKFLKD